MKAIFFVTAVVAASISLSATANSLKDELTALAREHPLIKGAGEDRISAQQQVKVSRSALLPNVLLTAGTGYEDQARPGGVEFDFIKQTSLISVRQLLFDFGAARGALETSQILEQQAGVRATQTSQDVLLAGIRAYFNYVFASERVVLARESEQSVATTRDLEQKKLDAGRGSQANVFQAESQRIGAETRVIQAEGEQEIAANSYERLFGHLPPAYESMEKTQQPSIGLPENLEKATKMALEREPGLIFARKNYEAASSETDVAKAAYYPRFELVAESEYRNDDRGIQGTFKENRLLLRLQYDFDLGFSQRNEVASARARQRSAGHANENQQRVTKESVRNAWERHEMAVKRYELARRQASKAEEFLELARQERDLGKRTLQDILGGELLLLNARTSLAQARAELTVASYVILRATGQLELSTI